MKVFSQKTKDKVWVHYEGRIYALPLQLKSAHGAAASQEEELIAPFSCKILKVYAKAGVKIKKGEPVLVVEAMKMEYTYASPRDGEIESILVQEAQTVQQGTHFVRWKASK